MVQPIMSRIIYKVSPRPEWQAAQSSRTYKGSDDDARDGFIHFSSASQLATTLAKHFAGQKDLVLISVDIRTLGDLLKWEKSRKGELFPHLYGPLSVSDVIRVQNLPLGENGHILPDLETA